MTGRTQLDPVPEWVIAEMPPGYRTRLLEIERLSADLHAMDGIGRVLWATGERLVDAVAALFGALKCEVDAAPGRPVFVNLGESRRLLLLVSAAAGPIEKTHEELAGAFQAMQFAGPADRVVFVANNVAATPPAERPEPVAPDALAVLGVLAERDEDLVVAEPARLAVAGRAADRLGKVRQPAVARGAGPA